MEHFRLNIIFTGQLFVLLFLNSIISFIEVDNFYVDKSIFSLWLMVFLAPPSCFPTYCKVMKMFSKIFF